MEGDPPQVERLQGASRGSESAHAVNPYSDSAFYPNKKLVNTSPFFL